MEIEGDSMDKLIQSKEAMDLEINDKRFAKISDINQEDY